MDLDALAAAIDAARASRDDGVVYDELAAQGFRRPSRKLPTGEQIRANVDLDPETGCWLWRGRPDAGGYGLWRGQGAHRVSYRVFVGPIPRGLHIDHLCRIRLCVNAPGGHLEAVTQAENTRRAIAYVQRFPGERVHHGAKRWCIRGHAFDEASTGIDAKNKRYCKRCRHEQLRTWRKEVAGQLDRPQEFHIDSDAWLASRPAVVPEPNGPELTAAEAAELCGMSIGAFGAWRRRNPELLRPLPDGCCCLTEVRAMLSFPQRPAMVADQVEGLSYSLSRAWRRFSAALRMAATRALARTSLPGGSRNASRCRGAICGERAPSKITRRRAVCRCACPALRHTRDPRSMAGEYGQ